MIILDRDAVVDLVWVTEVKIDQDSDQPEASVHFEAGAKDRLLKSDSVSFLVRVPIELPFDTDLIPSTVNEARRALADKLSNVAEILRREASEGRK